MFTSIQVTHEPRPVAKRVPLHGRLHAFRRRIVAWCVRRLLPRPPNVVGAGQLPRAGIHRILLCRPNHRLGNTVLTTPLMAELERQFPGAEVDVLGSGAACRGIYAGFASLGQLFLLERRALAHPLSTLATLRKLRAKRYDLVIHAAAGSSSGRIAAAMARARFQLHADAAGMPPSAHFAARPVQALRWALGADPSLPPPPPDLRLTAAERETARHTLRQVLQGDAGEERTPVLVVFPNATGSKCLDAAWWRIFLDELLRHVGPRRVVELVPADGRSRLDHAFPTYFTSDPRRLAAFIEAAGTYVSADCGVMPLAAATGATTIGLFGATDPRRYAPYGGRNAGFACGDGDATATAFQVARHLLAGGGTDS